jgi:hypothetical protein
LRADLSELELKLIDWLLPSDRKFYAAVKESIVTLPMSRDAEALYFGEYDDEFAETIAIGEAEVKGSKHSLILRLNEDPSGAMITVPADEQVTLVSTLSEWSTGSSIGQPVREIPVFASDRELIYTLALSPSERVLWLHHAESHYNQLIPVTGLLIELARLTRPGPAGRISNEAFFDLAKEAPDNTLLRALLEYNKKAKKFDASRIVITKEPGRTSLLDLVRRRR